MEERLALMQTSLQISQQKNSIRMGGGGGGALAAAFDLAAFRKVMIAPVKKSVNHSKTVTSMREMRRIHAILSISSPEPAHVLGQRWPHVHELHAETGSRDPASGLKGDSADREEDSLW